MGVCADALASSLHLGSMSRGVSRPDAYRPPMPGQHNTLQGGKVGEDGRIAARDGKTWGALAKDVIRTWTPIALLLKVVAIGKPFEIHGGRSPCRGWLCGSIECLVRFSASAVCRRVVAGQVPVSNAGQSQALTL